MGTDYFKRSDRIKIGASLLAVGFSLLCFQYQLVYKPCCDAVDYLRLGEIYAKSGAMDIGSGALRLYGYPLFLAVVVKASQIFLLPASYLVFLAQVTLYFLAVYLLSRTVASYFSHTYADIVFYALLSNVVVYPYLAISLSDGFSVILLIFIAYAVLHVFFGKSCPSTIAKVKSAYWLFLLGFLVGFSVMVRPANVYLLILVFIVVAACAYHCNVEVGNTGLGVEALSVVAGFLLAVAPQLVFNYSAYGVFGFMPVVDLGGAQIEWGLKYLKYATNLSGGSPQLYYTNPWFSGTPGGLIWYVDNPLLGLATIAVHIFAAFDFDYLFPYIYNLSPWYGPILFAFSHFVLFWGAIGYLWSIAALRNLTAGTRTPRARFPVILLTLLYAGLILGWISVHALTAVENRFSLPIVAALLPLAIWALFVKAKTMRRRKLIYGAFSVYLVAAWQLHGFIAALH